MSVLAPCFRSPARESRGDCCHGCQRITPLPPSPSLRRASPRQATFMKTLFRLFASLLCAGVARAADPGKPNIVFILADDLGYGDLACYGHPYARTPALDQLAREGTRFRQFNVTGVTCCPSRTGFMTSKFPATFHGYPANAGFADRVTITELLKKRGYRTGHFGKWHIGPETKNGTYGIDTIGADTGAE